MIWDAALSSGRVLVLYTYPQAPELECTLDGGSGPTKAHGSAPLSPHVLSLVNRESRIRAFTNRPERGRVVASRWLNCELLTLPSLWVATWLDDFRDWVCLDVTS